MNTKKWLLVTGVVAVMLIAAVAIVPLALAQGPVDGYGPGQMFNNQFGFGSRMGAGPGSGMGSRWGGPENSLVAVAAEKLGMDSTALIAELQGGKSIAQVAQEKDVAVDTIVDAFLATRSERLAELVNNGQLTQEQAGAMLATMRAKVTEHVNQAGLPNGQGYGPGYTDEDGDGVCDHAASGIGQQFGGQGGPGWRWSQ